MPDSSEVKKEVEVAAAAPAAATAPAPEKRDGEQYVVLADYIYNHSRGSLITAEQLAHEPEVYIKQGSLKRATQKDIKQGYADTADLPVYDSGVLTSIPREALIQQAKNERLAKPLDAPEEK